MCILILLILLTIYHIPELVTMESCRACCVFKYCKLYLHSILDDDKKNFTDGLITDFFFVTECLREMNTPQHPN